MRRLLDLGPILCALLVAAPAAAQDSDTSELLACGRISDPKLRLECFDALVEEYAPHSEKAPDVDDREVTTQMPVTKPEEMAATPGKDSADTTAAAATQEAVAAQIATVDELSLPHRTRITAFDANRRGDFRFKIEEGFLFERASGPGVRWDDLTGAEVTLSKNFLGAWRVQVEGRGRDLWVRPVNPRGP